MIEIDRFFNVIISGNDQRGSSVVTI